MPKTNPNLLSKVSAQLKKHSNSTSFLMTLAVYLVSLSVVSKFPSSGLEDRYAYSASSAAEALSTNHGFLNFLVSLLRFLLILSFAAVATLTIDAGLKKVATKEPFNLLYLVPLVGAVFGLLENALITLTILSPNALSTLFLALAGLFCLFKSLFSGTLTLILLLATVPILLKDFVGGIGRDGRQKISKQSS